MMNIAKYHSGEVRAQRNSIAKLQKDLKLTKDTTSTALQVCNVRLLKMIMGENRLLKKDIVGLFKKNSTRPQLEIDEEIRLLKENMTASIDPP